MRVLLAEDDTVFASVLISALAREGISVDWTSTLAATEAALRTGGYRLLLLDRKFPDGDGVKILGQLREVQKDLPILILTALDGTQNRVEGLDAGADDYLSKPFDMAELMARIRAINRRPSRIVPSISLANLVFDFESRQAYVNGEELVLPRRQVAVLEELCLRQGRTVQKNTLEKAVYGFDEYIESNALESHISRLRRALVNSGVEIRSMRGIGYVLKETTSRS